MAFFNGYTYTVHDLGAAITGGYVFGLQ